jgi:hypothetical protein
MSTIDTIRAYWHNLAERPQQQNRKVRPELLKVSYADADERSRQSVELNRPRP